MRQNNVTYAIPENTNTDHNTNPNLNLNPTAYPKETDTLQSSNDILWIEEVACMLKRNTKILGVGVAEKGVTGVYSTFGVNSLKWKV